MRAYVLLSTVCMGVMLISGLARKAGNPHFDEIDVERLNIVEKDGSVRLVLSNLARSPAVMEHGKPLNASGGRRPGLIFYNEEQTEAGGLIFEGNRGARRAGLYVADYNGITSTRAFGDLWQTARQIPDSARRADSLKVLDRLFGARGDALDSKRARGQRLGAAGEGPIPPRHAGLPHSAPRPCDNAGCPPGAARDQ